MFDPTQPAEGSPLQSAVMRSQLTSLKDLIDAVPTITSAVVDAITTLPAGSAATVDLTLTGSTLHFTFGLAQGAEGAQGIQGFQGEPGAQGPPFAQAVVDAVNTLDPGQAATVTVNFDGTNVRFTIGIPRGQDGQAGQNGQDGQQGPPGEVTNAQLVSAIATTAQSPGSVQPLALSFSDPPTAAELTQVQDKLNELLNALKRP